MHRPSYSPSIFWAFHSLQCRCFNRLVPVSFLALLFFLLLYVVNRRTTFTETQVDPFVSSQFLLKNGHWLSNAYRPKTRRITNNFHLLLFSEKKANLLIFRMKIFHCIRELFSDFCLYVRVSIARNSEGEFFLILNWCGHASRSG